MKVRCVKKFFDLVEATDRHVGDEWEVDEARLRALNSTVYGKLVEVAHGEAKKGRPTKAELLAMAAEKGIEVPKGATNPEIHKLIEEAE